jgi:hypothetical protein
VLGFLALKKPKKPKQTIKNRTENPALKNRLCQESKTEKNPSLDFVNQKQKCI